MISNQWLSTSAAIAPATANHIWQSTLCALAVAIVTLAFRRNDARIRYRLWLAASLKFLVPFSLLIDLASHLANPILLPDGRRGWYSAVQGFSQPFTFVIVARARHSGAAGYLPGLIAAIWLCGFVTVLMRWSRRRRRVVAVVRRSTPVSQGRELATLRQLEQRAGLRRPIALLRSRDSLEPGIFGIVHPRLLWPAAISDHLRDTHIRAILAHEVSHVRRRDNLTAATHMAVEAIFWFHPLIWWLGARLVEERERACDEEVVLLGNPPAIYAESILKTCEFCLESPLACVSGVTGADLKKRVVRIMTDTLGEKLSLGKKFLLASAGVAAVASPILFGLMNSTHVSAQSAPASRGLAVAAIDAAQQPKQSPSQDPAKEAGPAPQIYHVGGDVSAPKLIYAPDPVYTEEAKRAKYQGVCVVTLIVAANGKPQHIQVTRHLDKGLDKNAVEAVRQYKFEPAMLHGKPVAVQVNIEVNFRIN